MHVIAIACLLSIADCFLSSVFYVAYLRNNRIISGKNWVWHKTISMLKVSKICIFIVILVKLFLLLCLISCAKFYEKVYHTFNSWCSHNSTKRTRDLY